MWRIKSLPNFVKKWGAEGRRRPRCVSALGENGMDRIERLAEADDLAGEESLIEGVEGIQLSGETTESAGQRVYENADKKGRIEVWEWGDETLVVDSEWVPGSDRDAGSRLAMYDEEGMVYGLTRTRTGGEVEVTFDVAAEDPFGVQTVEDFRNAYRELTGRSIDEDLDALEDYSPAEERHEYLE